MPIDDERCADAARIQRIDEAFRRGNLEALRAAVDDPGALPNGPVPPVIGSCLVYAIYRSPLAFIRTLLDMGADPNAPADDGFPPVIAALGCAREVSGAAGRSDVDEIVRLLLSRGADPNQRGINDYTALHMAVAERAALAVQILLDGGADPALRTRIDACETAAEMAAAAGLTRSRRSSSAGAAGAQTPACGADPAGGHRRHGRTGAATADLSHSPSHVVEPGRARALVHGVGTGRSCAA